MSSSNAVFTAIERFGGELDRLEVVWAIGGSIACSTHAEPRSANGADFIACLRPRHAARLVRALRGDFFIDEAAVLGAIVSHRWFNLIHERTFVKLDVFVPPPGPLGEGQLRRRLAIELDHGFRCHVLGREDTALQKLRWYRLGGCHSERDWDDILGLLDRPEQLDLTYLREVAELAQLDELLERALAEAG